MAQQSADRPIVGICNECRQERFLTRRGDCFDCFGKAVTRLNDAKLAYRR